MTPSPIMRVELPAAQAGVVEPGVVRPGAVQAGAALAAAGQAAAGQAGAKRAAVVPVRVAIITMDSHLSGAARRAAARLRAELPGLELSVHAADAWCGDAQALAACLRAIETADIVFASMLFLDAHIRDVLPALTARQASCDAMVCCLSAGEVVRLTRIGRLRMDVPASGMMGMLKRLRGARKPAGAGGKAGAAGGGKAGGGEAGRSSGEKQMRLLRQLPRILRFVPGTAQDLRVYFLCLQYWLAGSEENLANMLRLLVGRYAAGPRAAGAGALRAAPPVQYPELGLYHPRLPARVVEDASLLPRVAGERGRVGLLLMRSYLLADNAAHYDGMIAALEARGLSVVPAFASGLDQRPAIERYFTRDGAAAVDVVLSLTGFSLVGGPAYNDAHAAEEVLAGLDVPYVAAHPVEFQTLRAWEDSPHGLTPIEAAMMVAIPELDGALWPTTFGGRAADGVADGAAGSGLQAGGQHEAAAGGRACTMVAHAERCASLAARIERLAGLRRRERQARRVAVVLFNFPPNGGATGTAAYLSVFRSLHNTLLAMREAGYRVEVPASADALRTLVCEGNAGWFGAPANVAARVPAAEHVRRERWLEAIEAQWGPAPGQHNSDGDGLFILGAQLGNVFVGIQPAFGMEGDPMRLMFTGSFAPTHAFSAFYRWIREDFAADAVLHWGTHGALEFMPGKQVGMSGACWPDRLIGELPNFYLYASNNPSEGALAKRRTGAALISYLTPPVAEAGLYRGLLDLKASLGRWSALPPDSPAEQSAALLELIRAEAGLVDLVGEDEPAWDAAAAQARIQSLGAALLELEYTLIPEGLHVVGEPPDAAARARLLDAAGISEPERRASLDALLARDNEIPSLLHALDGGYLRPAPGGDLLRNTDVLPTGRNLHGFDPFRIPSAFALSEGARQAERLLERHRADSGRLPETVAMVLWGTDNLKTEGGPLSQALWLLGAEPRLDSYGRLAGAALVPLERLGRPRIDVVLTLSGIFRDLLPMQTRLLAEASRMAAEADEPVACNAVRRHALAFQAEHGGTLAEASLRVFGNDDGAYGSNVNHLLEHGGWTDEDELAQCFLRRKGFAYDADGHVLRHDRVLDSLLGQVDLAYQNLDSIELGVTTVDHYFDTLGGITRAVLSRRGQAAAVYIGDGTRGDGVVRSLAEQVALETRTRALNPKWYEALLEHGFEGVRQIEAQVTNTLGWSATTGQVAPWVYQRLSDTFILDEAMRERLARLNPAATARIAGRLIEAHERHYWQPAPDVVDALRLADEAIEDRLEGIEVAAA